jgi:hypothetical protein
VHKYSPVFDVLIQQQPFLAAIAWGTCRFLVQACLLALAQILLVSWIMPPPVSEYPHVLRTHSKIIRSLYPISSCRKRLLLPLSRLYPTLYGISSRPATFQVTKAFSAAPERFSPRSLFSWSGHESIAYNQNTYDFGEQLSPTHSMVY